MISFHCKLYYSLSDHLKPSMYHIFIRIECFYTIYAANMLGSQHVCHTFTNFIFAKETHYCTTLKLDSQLVDLSVWSINLD